MATEIMMQREPGRPGLHPVSAFDEETLAGVPMKKPMTATLTQKRSGKQNRFYFAMLAKIARNHDFYASARPLHLWLKTRLGYVESIEFHDGEIITRASSTAFDKMDGLAMREYMDLALGVLCAEIIPGLDRTELLAEIERDLGMRFEEAFPPEGK